MLKVPRHQVAGHKANDGKLGPLIDSSGRFYKPLQSDNRGSEEVAFYESFSSNTKIPTHIRRFFPIFYGTQLVEASDGSGLCNHLVLQDLASSRLNSSIIDIKIGSRTWPLQESEEYIKKCVGKDKETTSLSLGFRISGLQIYGSKELGYWKPEKKLIKTFCADDVRLALRKFVSSNGSDSDMDSDPDCAFAAIVYGGTTGILAQLLELKEWFEEQTIFHFFSCSVLFMYEKELLEGRNSRAEIKLIDFAHVMDAQGIIDHNFLGGLCSLIKFISEILATPNGHTIKACPKGTHRNAVR